MGRVEQVDPRLVRGAVHDDPVEDFANTDVVITTVVITAAPQELPGTASIVPLLGALGAGLLALGGGLGLLRRQLRR